MLTALIIFQGAVIIFLNHLLSRYRRSLREQDERIRFLTAEAMKRYEQLLRAEAALESEIQAQGAKRQVRELERIWKEEPKA